MLWQFTGVLRNDIVVPRKPIFTTVNTTVKCPTKTCVHCLDNIPCSCLSTFRAWFVHTLRLAWAGRSGLSKCYSEFISNSVGEVEGELPFAFSAIGWWVVFTIRLFSDLRRTCLRLSSKSSLDTTESESVCVLGSTVFPCSTKLLLVLFRLVISLTRFVKTRCLHTSSGNLFSSISHCVRI